MVVALAATVHAETGYEAWLRYAPLPAPVLTRVGPVPRSITLLGASPVLRSARDEAVRGLSSMLAAPITTATALPRTPTILLGTLDRVRSLVPSAPLPDDVTEDGFWLGTVMVRDQRVLVVSGGND